MSVEEKIDSLISVIFLVFTFSIVQVFFPDFNLKVTSFVTNKIIIVLALFTLTFLVAFVAIARKSFQRVSSNHKRNRPA